MGEGQSVPAWRKPHRLRHRKTGQWLISACCLEDETPACLDLLVTLTQSESHPSRIEELGQVVLRFPPALPSNVSVSSNVWFLPSSCV